MEGKHQLNVLCEASSWTIFEHKKVFFAEGLTLLEGKCVWQICMKRGPYAEGDLMKTLHLIMYPIILSHTNTYTCPLYIHKGQYKYIHLVE